MSSMINSSSIETKENDQRIRRKKNDGSSVVNLSAQITDLCDSINNLCHPTDNSFKQILEDSNSILGKFYQLFLTLRNRKDLLVNSIIFNEFIRKKTEGLIIKFNHQTNKYSMNFIQFIQQIELLAKENQLSKEYLLKKLLHPTLLDNNPNRSNNALDSSRINDTRLLNEYNNDFSRLKTYFIRQCEIESRALSDHQMSCSRFVKCISENVNLKKLDYHLELNDIFNQIYSSLVHQGVYIPASHTIDLDGFLLCLQHIARTFHFNLRILIKTLINSTK